MKYIKISLFLGIIFFSGFFVDLAFAESCAYNCTNSQNGKTCITLSPDNTPENQAILNLLKTQYGCADLTTLIPSATGGCDPDVCPGIAISLNNCSCSFLFEGKGCNVNKEIVYPFTAVPRVRDFIHVEDFQKCPKEAFQSDIVDLSQIFNVSSGNCSKIDEKMIPSLAGYKAEIYCIEKIAPSNFVPGSGLSTDIKSWSKFGETIIKGSSGTTDTGTKPQTVSLVNPLGTTNLIEIFGKLIKAFVGLVGMIVLVVFVYGGFMWLLSAGNPEKIKKGTQAMMYALIGLFIIFSAYVIISTILKAL